jgi:hypothetical protein
MKINSRIKCPDLPCTDVDKNSHIIPNIEVNPSGIKVVMIAEAPPNEKSDYFYATGKPFYLQTTIQALNDAGFNVSSMQDILNLGVYITTAI